MADNILQKAKDLRIRGLTYKEISSALDGVVSVDWCKRNLKGVQKEKVSNSCVLELIQKATRPEGITVYEANAIIFQHNKDKTLSRDQMKNIRKKASYADNNCLFRPAWIDATKPTESYKSMIAYVDHLSNELDNVTRWYCDSYPTVNKGAVQYELMKHLFPKISGEPLSGRIMRSEVMVETLASRKIDTIRVGEELDIDSEDAIKTEIDLNIKDTDLDGCVFLSESELDAIWKV